jgi:hypothetical protein
MAIYMVEYIPVQADDESVSEPTDLEGLARHSLDSTHGARWLTTFSPGLHDERHFSLWESPGVDEIRAVMAKYGFLSDGVVKAFVVRQWGPSDVLSEHQTEHPDW